MPLEPPAAAPIRIARVITRLNVGGPAIQAIEMSARLEPGGFHTLLIHGRLGPAEGDMRYRIPPAPAFETEYIRALRRELAPFADGAAVLQIFRLLCSFRPAIVHTHMAKAGAIGRQLSTVHSLQR